MLKHALFFGNSWKNRTALEAHPSPNPRWPPAAGDSASHTPNLLFPLIYLFVAQISRHR